MVPGCLQHYPLTGIYRLPSVVPPRKLGEHHAITSCPGGFKPRSDSVPRLSQMSGTNGPDAHQARAHRIRVAHVSGRQLRSRR
jgi:hypothetical protein